VGVATRGPERVPGVVGTLAPARADVSSVPGTGLAAGNAPAGRGAAYAALAVLSE